MTSNTPAPQVEMVSDEMVVEACLAYEIAMDGDVRRLDVPWIAMEAALQAALQVALNARAGGGGWLPIESAPEDGSEFQAWFTNDDGSIGDWEPRARVNESGNIEFWGRVDYDQDGWVWYPELIYTHWQPLPTPPSALASQAVGVK